jgi:hypothetical protein
MRYAVGGAVLFNLSSPSTRYAEFRCLGQPSTAPCFSALVSRSAKSNDPFGLWAGPATQGLDSIAMILLNTIHVPTIASTMRLRLLGNPGRLDTRTNTVNARWYLRYYEKLHLLFRSAT